jgi:hypothetical protein
LSVIVCGLPRTEDGKYNCKYCGFTSDDIEDFATSMCWSCVYSEEETQTKEENSMTNLDQRYNEGTELTLDQVRVGDHLLIYREVDVRSVDKYDKMFTTKDNREIRMGGHDLQGKPYPAFKVRKITKPGPDNWPPMAGQVWRDSTSTEYFVLSQPGDGVKIFTVDDKLVSLEDLEKKPDVKLVYSSGQ